MAKCPWGKKQKGKQTTAPEGHLVHSNSPVNSRGGSTVQPQLRLYAVSTLGCTLKARTGIRGSYAYS